MGFEDEIKVWIAKTEMQLGQTARKVTLELHKRIVTKTPVDTGRLKANNQIGIGSKETSSTTDFDKSPKGTHGKTVAKEGAKVSSYKPGDDIWITNNVEYAYPVEVGHHKVPAVGMFQTSVDDIVSAWPNIVEEVKKSA